MRNNLPPKCCQVWKTYRILYRRPSGCFTITTKSCLHPHKRPTPSTWPEWQLVGVLLLLWAVPYPQRTAKPLTWCALVQLVCVIEFHSRRNDMEQSTTHATPLPDTVSATHSKWVVHTGRDYEKRTSVHSTIRFRLNQQL
ncbi:unnamed protein product [Ixodes pacificus]